jgi:hypothetical protein
VALRGESLWREDAFSPVGAPNDDPRVFRMKLEADGAAVEHAVTRRKAQSGTAIAAGDQLYTRAAVGSTHLENDGAVMNLAIDRIWSGHS